MTIVKPIKTTKDRVNIPESLSGNEGAVLLAVPFFNVSSSTIEPFMLGVVDVDVKFTLFDEFDILKI